MRSGESQQSIKKPSLLSGPGDAVAANGGILAGLEKQGDKGFSVPKKKRGRRSIRTSIVVGLLSILGAGVAIVVYQNDAALPVQHAPPQAVSPHSGLIAKKTNPAPVAESGAEPEGLAALIVNEPVAVANSPSSAGAPGIAVESVNPSFADNSQETKVLPPDVSNKKLPQTGSTSIQKNPAASPKLIAGARTPATATEPVAGARVAGNKSSSVISTEKQGVVAANRQTADRDVALLEVLVAHSAKQPRALESPKKSVGSNPQPVPATIAKAGGNNRDFVERKPGDSTESLLQRCNGLGFFEGELCRWRMCSGRWESDAACKVAPEGQ